MSYLRKAISLLLTIILCLNMCTAALGSEPAVAEVPEAVVELEENMDNSEPEAPQQEKAVYEEPEQIVSESDKEDLTEKEKVVTEQVADSAQPREKVENEETIASSTAENPSDKDLNAVESEPDTVQPESYDENEVATDPVPVEETVSEDSEADKTGSDAEQPRTEAEQLVTDELSEDYSESKEENAVPVFSEEAGRPGESKDVPEAIDEMIVDVEEDKATPEEIVPVLEDEVLEEEVVEEDATLEEEVVEEDEALEEEVVEEEVEIESAEVVIVPEDITLSPNSIQNFYLEGIFTQKAYITLSSPGYLNLFVRFINSPQPQTKAIVRFMNANLTSTYLYETISSTNNLAEISDWFDAGSYCVLINIIGDNGDNYYPVSYSIENKFVGVNIEASNGNINASANLPTDGAYHEGLLSRTSNSRWWRITLTQPGFLEVDVRSFVAGRVASDVYQLRDGQMNRRTIRPLSISLAPASPTSPRFRYASTWLESGDYYLNVYAEDQQTGEYSVMVSFKAANNTESNDDGNYLSANRLVLDGNTIRGLMSYTDEVDMFAFTVNETTNVNVSVAAFMDALNVKLYNANMRLQLADLSATGTGGNMNKAHNHEDRIRLNPGEYILVISRDPNMNLTGVYEARVRSTITIRTVNLPYGLLYNLGDTITGNISYGSGTPLLYYFHLQMLNTATNTYTNVNHLTTAENFFAFAPTNPGTYRVLAEVSDGVYTDTWASEAFVVKGNPALTINSIDYDPGAPVEGEPMKITAGIGGGGEIKNLIYYIYTTGGVLVDKFTTPGTPGVWIPRNPAGGPYNVMVVAEDVNGAVAAAWGSGFTVTPAPAFAITNVDLSITTSVKLNSPVTATVTTVNGNPVVYVYELYFNGNFLSRSASTSNTFTFRPNAAGTWQVMAVARSDKDAYASAFSSSFTVLSTPAIAVETIVNPTSIPQNGTVDVSLKYSGSPTVTSTCFELWNSGTGTLVDTSGWVNSATYSFAIASPGTYLVKGVIQFTEAPYYDADWSDPIMVSAPSPVNLTACTPNKTTSFVNDVVTYNVTWSSASPTPIQFFYYVYNASNACIYSEVSTRPVFKYQYKAPGKYLVMAVASDGYTWDSVWSSPQSTVNSFGALTLTVNIAGGNAKTFLESFTAVPRFSNGQRIKQVFYEIYDATSSPATLLMASGGTSAATYTYQPQPWAVTSSINTFRVMVVASDGYDWATAWSAPITYTLPTPLSVTTVTDNTTNTVTNGYGVFGSVELGDSVEFTGMTQGGSAILETEFQVYYNPNAPFTGTLIETVNTRNNDSLLTIPTNRGYYQVYFVAFDGITWAGKYSNWIYVDSSAF